jgi:peptidoglycan/LPS O-acetylase OafA/YrhL
MIGASRGAEARVTDLDGLRGVLAWTVVASHILLVSGWYDPLVRRFPIIGDVPESAVDVFMILSGFAITHVLMMHPRLDTYFVRRACRIVPAYYVALLLGILFNGMAADNLRRLPPGTIGAGYVPILEIGSARMWLDAPLHLLFLHGLIPTTMLPALPYTLLGVAWSLSLEFQFYLVAPALIAFCRRWHWALAILIVAILTTTLYAGRMMTVFSNAFLPAKAVFFLVGSLSFFVIESRGSRGRAWILCLSLNTALCLFWWLGAGRLYEAILVPLVWGVVIVAIRFKCLGPLRGILNSRLLQLLGRISYSTYLFHAPVIFLLQAAIWRWLNPSSTWSLLVWTSTIGIPAIFLVSWISWRQIERPFQRLGRRYAQGG